MVYCAVMVGLKPEKMEINIITKFVKNNYPVITLENIIEAFEINSSGKKWALIETYGSFNTMFVGKVLTAFETYNRQRKLTEIKALPVQTKKDIISHEEAKPMLEKLKSELKKIDLKFRINNKKRK